MADWFGDLTKLLADSTLPRRQAIRRISGAVAGIALASWLPEQAFAASEQRHHCGYPGTCSSTTVQCGFNKYNNCFCLQRLDNGKGVCCCNTYCSSAPPCTRSAQCGKGYACITNTGCGCTTGVCLQKCTHTCQLGSGRSGRTAAA